MNERDFYWMRHAIDLAKQAELANEVPVGAVLVRDEVIVGRGYNRCIGNHDPSAHAEIIAIRDMASREKNYRLLDTTLYVTLEPCIMCVGAMVQARITRLVFGAYDKKAGAVGSVFNILEPNVLNHKIIFQSGILAEECAALLTSFFQLRRLIVKQAKEY